MIIVVTGMFDTYDKYGNSTGLQEFGVSHGIDYETGRNVILETVNYPSELGAVWDNQLCEWVIHESV